MKRVILILSLVSLLVVVTVRWTNERKEKPRSIRVGHKVTLTWSASASRDVISYNIYVSHTSGGPYTLLSSVSATASHSFVDTAVISGETYFFVVTAVNYLGEESSYSDQAIAVVPSP